MRRVGPAGVFALLLAGAALAAPTANAPVHWPSVYSRVARDPAIEARIGRIMARMSLEEKVGQVIQGDINFVTPEDVRKYKLGSILAGGNSAPNNDNKAPAGDWLKQADAFWNASRAADWKGEKIPLIYGIDAVHGHANIVGATIFPQNIGLGAMRDPELIRRIGEVTAEEMVATGFDWDFSPTLAVVRDDRWGRTYEGFSEDPSIVRMYAGKMVEGLQGRAGTKDFLGPRHVMSSAKHFVGDGGTAGGKDQGDNPGSPREIRDIHGAGYPPAIEAGVQNVMSSFSSIRGVKMAGDKALLTGALKGDMHFDGFVVDDWNAHGQVPGCTNTSCAAAMNAGVDMFMAPDSWKGLYENTLKQVQSGEIPMSRLDDAVRRILRVKLRAHMFDKGAPSTRPLGGHFELLGSPEHRAVARQAARESLVLLKNAHHMLPLSPKMNILVAGDGADNISKQSGGWTITWQGTGLTNADFPHAQSIWSGIDQAVSAAGGKASLSVDGSYSAKPNVAIVVFGEDPYAEFVGDRPRSLEFSPADKKDLELLRKLRAAGIPTVSVFLSGRPMWVNPELNASDAFVAAFLPGGEGGGIADVIFRRPDGRVHYDFHGKLSYSWPRRADQFPLNVGDKGYDPLFAFGYGLRYGQKGDVPKLSEERPKGGGLPEGVLFGRGAVPQGWSFAFEPTSGGQIKGVDRRAQEDSRQLVWSGAGPATAAIHASPPLDLSRETTGQLSMVIDYRVDSPPSAPVTLSANPGGSVPIGGVLRGSPVGEWRTLTVPLGCFAKGGADMKQLTVPYALTTAGRLTLTISDVRILSAPVPQDQCGAP
ncbi:MAG TPA: exo 1,3/1,4-beta-D-glucan glucohydrolase [Sphingomicrobium sp.]|nr:exo 1,3/1,4-beta-D-glucan glucohydrolase [Sphingomicrobium sp.]